MHELTGIEPRIVRRHDFAHCVARHHIVQCGRLDIGSHVVQLAAHIWVDGQIVNTNQSLAGSGRGKWGLDELEAVFGNPAGRSAVQQDFAMGFSHWDLRLF